MLNKRSLTLPALIFLIFLPSAVFAEKTLPANITRAISECLADMNSGQPQAVQKGEQRLQNICNILTDPEHETKRIETEGFLAAVVSDPENGPSQRWLLRMLAQIGSQECVQAVQKFLSSRQDVLFEEAIATLSQIPGLKAGDALRDFLAKTEDFSKKIAIITALGFREEPESIEPLTKVAESLERGLSFEEKQLRTLTRVEADDESLRKMIQRRELNMVALWALGQIGTEDAADRLQLFRFSATPERKLYFAPALVACTAKMIQNGQNREALAIYYFIQRSSGDISDILGVQIACANGVLRIAASSENIQYFLFLLENGALYDLHLANVCARFLWDTQGNTAEHILPEDEETQNAMTLLNQYDLEKRWDALSSRIPEMPTVEEQNSKIRKKNTRARITEKEAIAAENVMKKKRLERFFKFPIGFQAMLLDILGERRDESLLPFAQKALGSEDANVRAAAMKAIAFIGNEDSIAFLLEQLSNEVNNDSPNRQKIVYGLKRTTVPGADQKIADTIQSTTNVALKNSLLEIATSRYLSMYYPLFQNAMNSDEASTRHIAAMGIASVFREDDLFLLLEMLLRSDDPDKQADIENVIVRFFEKPGSAGFQPANGARKNTMQTVPDRTQAGETPAVPGEYVTSVLDFYEKADPNRRFALFGLLSHIGGKKAFEAVLAAMRSENVSVKEAAFESLCRWPDGNALDELYRLSSKLTNKERAEKALLGYVRLLVGENERSVAETLFLIQKALEQSQKKETQEEIFLWAASLQSEETLDFLIPYLDQPRMRSMACEAILKLAEAPQFRASYRNRIDPLLNGIMRNADSRDMSERAWNLLKQNAVLSTK